MSKKNKIKLLIPNILTFTRLALTPFIVILGLLGHFKIVLILVIIGSITDLLDGLLARYFNTVSEFGAKIDTISDKVFAISLLLAVVRNYKVIIPVIILEILIASMNVYFYKKYDNIKSLFIGKIKTATLFISITLLYLLLIKNIDVINKLAIGFIYITINLQILSIAFYLKYNLNFKKEDKKVIIDEIKEEDMEKTISLDSIEDLKIDDYNDIV